MKKAIMATVLMGIFGSAMATEVGIEGGRTYGSTENSAIRLTVDQPVGAFVVQGNYSRPSTGTVRANQFGASVGYGVLVGPVTITPRVGAAYVSNTGAETGYGVTAGVDASVPVYQGVSVVAGIDRFIGQDSVNALNGNYVFAGLKYKF